jgi:hypothetical protein
MALHPRVFARGTKRELSGGGDVRAIAYSPTPHRIKWIENELDRDGTMLQVSRNITGIVAALLDDPPPHPQILVLDLDGMSAGELMYLHVVREQGWFGSIIALGKVPDLLRISLSIDQVLTPPFVRDSLRDAIAALHLRAETTQMPTII